MLLKLSRLLNRLPCVQLSSLKKLTKRNRFVHVLILCKTTIIKSIFFQSIIIQAEGEAKSAELVGESLKKNKGFLELRRLEAAREIANTLAQSQNRVMLDSQALLLNGTYIYL